jgi:hypothetical protein
LSRPIIVRTRGESHQWDGITDPKRLQLPFATKSATSGLMHCSNFVVIRSLSRHGQAAEARLGVRRSSCGTFATFAAIRRAWSRVSSLAAAPMLDVCGAWPRQQSRRRQKPTALPFSPQMPTSGKASLGLSSRQWEGDISQPCVPHASS